jgi:hypothetical protein
VSVYAPMAKSNVSAHSIADRRLPARSRFTLGVQ